VFALAPLNPLNDHALDLCGVRDCKTMHGVARSRVAGKS
jgi:hypothetical protein